MASPSRKDFSASGRLPCATSTSPTRSYDTDRSRCQPALPYLYIGDEPKCRIEIALPARVAGVGLRQTVGNRQPVAERFQRPRQIALRHQHVAAPRQSDCDLALISCAPRKLNVLEK